MKFAASATVALAGASTVTAALVAKDIVEIMAPKSKECSGEDPNKECRTAAQMAPHLIAGAAEYEAYHVNEIISGLALGLFESGDGRYKKNLNPENHGQGTFNMQGCKFNCLYAKDLEATKDDVADIDCETAQGDQCDKIIDLVIPDELNFATPWWFLATQCEETVRESLRADIDKGFEAHMKCVGVEVNDERRAYLNLGKKAIQQLERGDDAEPGNGSQPTAPNSPVKTPSVPSVDQDGEKEVEDSYPQPGGNTPQQSTTKAGGATETGAAGDDEEC